MSQTYTDNFKAKFYLKKNLSKVAPSEGRKCFVGFYSPSRLILLFQAKQTTLTGESEYLSWYDQNPLTSGASTQLFEAIVKSTKSRF